MGDRYWLSGVELGILKASLEHNDIEAIKKILERIENERFIGRIEQGEKGVLKVGIIKDDS